MHATTKHTSRHLLSRYQTELDALAQAHHRRVCLPIEHPTESVITIQGHPVVNFSSNDYLGLAMHPALKKAVIQAVETNGTSQSSSRLISGTSTQVSELENAIAQWQQTESALVFNTGYQGNVALLQALLDKHTWVFADKYNHASLVDGCLLSGAKLVRYRHLDLEQLASKLSEAPKGAPKWIITDSLFSMDGDHVNLTELSKLAELFDAGLMIDEAHAVGIFGNTHASGLCEVARVTPTLKIGTFSKALGSFGAYVAGPKVLMEYLVNHARGFIYSTAAPPAVIAANCEAVQVVQQEPQHRAQLLANLALFKTVLTDCNLPCASDSQIIPMIISDDAKALHVAEQLLKKGFYVRAVRPPTVPPGTARLRISVTAKHTPEQLTGLAQALQEILT